jgi:hypothetical protein
MPYDEQLARNILVALNERFPEPIGSDVLKNEVPQFTQVSQDAWRLALDALLHLRHIEGRDIRTGYDHVLQGILNCRITPLGRETLSSAITWKEFYWKWLNYFGKEFFSKRRGKLLAALVGGIGLFLAGRNPEAWINWKNATIGTLLGVGVWTLVDFVRVPWLIQSEPAGAEQRKHVGFTVLGASVLVAMTGGLFYLTFPLWMPKRHRYEIPYNDEFANLTNAQHAFKSLSVQIPNCIVRLTAPSENRQVVQVLSNIAGDFCKLEEPPNSNNADIDVLAGSEQNAVVVHVTKATTSKDEIRDGILGDLQNVLAVRFKHDLPPGSPPGLIWIQVGRGYPWRKDNGD